MVTTMTNIIRLPHRWWTVMMLAILFWPKKVWEEGNNKGDGRTLTENQISQDDNTTGVVDKEFVDYLTGKLNDETSELSSSLVVIYSLFSL